MNALSQTLDDFLDRRGAVHDTAKATLHAIDANELFDIGLPRLATVKGARVDRLLTLLLERAPAAHPERLADQLIAATQVKCARQNYWSPELSWLFEVVATQDRVIQYALGELFAKESAVPVLRRCLAAQILGDAATPLALRALATRARMDRARPAEDWRKPLPGQTTLPKKAPWRGSVIVGLAKCGVPGVASVLLEEASPWPTAEFEVWSGLFQTLGAEALPWIVQRFSREPTAAIRTMGRFDHPDVRQWLRCLTASRDVDVHQKAVDALVELDRDEAAPWLIGFIETTAPWTLSGDARHAWVQRQLDIPYQPGRRGGLDGETCPFALVDDDERPTRLDLTEAQRADVEAQEDALVFSDAELRSLLART